MILSGKKILLISPEPWDHIFVSKHHYAIHLAASGNSVYFLNPPTKSNRVSETKYKNLFCIDYRGFISGLRFLPRFIQMFFTLREFKKIELRAGVSFNIVWSFDNSVFFDFAALPNRILSISHIMDLNQNFQTKKAAQTATVCFGVIPEIVARLKLYNSNSYLIRHGVSINHLNSCDSKLPGNGKLKALYIGNLSMPFIDWDLLTKAITLFDFVDFIFMGSKSHSLNKLKVYSNVFFVDRVPAEELPNYFRVADILLLAYNRDYYTNHASPHKLMEYFLSGKPVVGSFTPEYEAYPDLIYMGKTHEEWLNQLDEIVNNIEVYTKESLVSFRTSFALSNTYEKQIARIQNIIGALDWG